MDILLNQWYSPILGLVGIFLAIIGLVLTIIFYRRSQRFKEPCWAIRNLVLIEGYSTKISDLEVTYKDQRIENLSVSRIVIWNEGKETIDGKDIAQANPLRISTTDDVHILDAKVIATNNPSSQFDVLDDEKVALLKFDYIDHKQGGVIQLVHTGKSFRNLILEGDIKGAKSPRKVQLPVYTRLNYLPPFNKLIKKGTDAAKIRRWLILSCMIFFLIFFATTIAFIILPASLENPSNPPIYASIMKWGTVIMTSSVCIVLINSLLNFLRRRIPQGLEVFDEEILQPEES